MLIHVLANISANWGMNCGNKTMEKKKILLSDIDPKKEKACGA
jgi:hypothetical protein